MQVEPHSFSSGSLLRVSERKLMSLHSEKTKRCYNSLTLYHQHESVCASMHTHAYMHTNTYTRLPWHHCSSNLNLKKNNKKTSLLNLPLAV